MNRDEIIEMAREAGVYARGYYDETGSTPEELERFFHAAYAAGAAAERERVEAERQPLHIMNGCPVCHMGANGRAMGYACTRGDCPTRVTCTGAV